ncbi:MAG: hypothetical protein DI623_01740 [Sphingomonas sanxanigenens]|uniref:Uncharacterized protein n=1 Tax=Sphingomonas sanxanigenens TaxID=397260 RepID=A0A2W5AFC6_9SPHN|nr:MAG: hypothetical protein DI623_01740 [Sphingomonas sanxanigenens]
MAAHAYSIPAPERATNAPASMPIRTPRPTAFLDDLAGRLDEMIGLQAMIVTAVEADRDPDTNLTRALQGMWTMLISVKDQLDEGHGELLRERRNTAP